jgi:hypothetical protein
VFADGVRHERHEVAAAHLIVDSPPDRSAPWRSDVQSDSSTGQSFT